MATISRSSGDDKAFFTGGFIVDVQGDALGVAAGPGLSLWFRRGPLIERD